MKFHLNPDTVLNACKVKLGTDSVLIGSLYLNGSNKIFTNRSPTDAVAPWIVIASPFGFTQSNSLFSGEVRIFCYTVLGANDQILPLGNQILTRCAELLINETLTISGMTNIDISSPGQIPAIVDQETDKHKSRGVLRLNISLGYNP